MANAFRLDELDGKIGLVTFDLPDKKVNTLSQEVLQELAGLVGQLEKRTDLRGLLFKSGKPGQFVAGADLNELAAMSYATPEQVAGLIGFGPPAFQPDQPAAVSDGGPDRRRLPGRRDRAGPDDGRAAGLDRAAHADQSAGSPDRHPARLGRNAAAAALDRPQRGHRDDLRGREPVGPEGRRPSASRSTRSRPSSWSTKGAG